MNLLGFEYEPKTEAQTDVIEETMALLNLSSNVISIKVKWVTGTQQGEGVFGTRVFNH